MIVGLPQTRPVYIFDALATAWSQGVAKFSDWSKSRDLRTAQ